MRIQTRAGYYAWPETPGKRAEDAVDSVLAGPFDAGEIGLWGTLVKGAKGPTTERIEIHADPDDVALTTEGGEFNARMRIAVAQYQPEGLVGNVQMFNLDAHYTAQQIDGAIRDGIGFAGDVTIGDKASSVRVVVFDRNSNSVGSLTFPFRTPEETGR